MAEPPAADVLLPLALLLQDTPCGISFDEQDAARNAPVDVRVVLLDEAAVSDWPDLGALLSCEITVIFSANLPHPDTLLFCSAQEYVLLALRQTATEVRLHDAVAGASGNALCCTVSDVEETVGALVDAGLQPLLVESALVSNGQLGAGVFLSSEIRLETHGPALGRGDAVVRVAVTTILAAAIAALVIAVPGVRQAVVVHRT